MRVSQVFFMVMAAVILSGCQQTYNTTLPIADAGEPSFIDVGQVSITLADRSADAMAFPLPISAGAFARQWLTHHVQAGSANDERMVIIVDGNTVVKPSERNARFDKYMTTINVVFRHYVPSQNLALKESDMLLRIGRELDRDAEADERAGFNASLLRDVAKRLEENVPIQLDKHFPDMVLSDGVVTEPITMSVPDAIHQEVYILPNGDAR